MNKKQLFIWGLMLVIPFMAWSQTETYSYQGPMFDVFAGSYDGNMSVSGEFTVPEQFSTNMPLTDISTNIQSYRFTDGVQELDETNSQIIQFNIATDATGLPLEWQITVWATPITTVPNGPVFGIDTGFTQDVNGAAADTGFLDGQCFDNTGPGGQCVQASIDGTDSGSFFEFNPAFAPGRWQGPLVPVAVPAMSELALFLMAVLLIVAGGLAFHKARRSYSAAAGSGQ